MVAGLQGRGGHNLIFEHLAHWLWHAPLDRHEIGGRVRPGRPGHPGVELLDAVDGGGGEGGGVGRRGGDEERGELARDFGKRSARKRAACPHRRVVGVEVAGVGRRRVAAYSSEAAAAAAVIASSVACSFLANSSSTWACEWERLTSSGQAWLGRKERSCWVGNLGTEPEGQPYEGSSWRCRRRWAQ